VYERLEKIPSPPPPGITSFGTDETVNARFIAAAGFRIAGGRAIRLDMLDRLEDKLETAAATGESADDLFPKLVSLLGCDRETLQTVLSSLNWTRVGVADPAAPRTVWRQNVGEPRRHKPRPQPQARDIHSPFAELAILVAAD
jgi:ATP-dependent RNA helicase SUPV3L1/SUV3